MKHASIKETASLAAVEAMKTALNIIDRNSNVLRLDFPDRMTVLTLMACDLIARLEVLIESDGNMEICRPLIDDIKTEMWAKKKEMEGRA